MASDFSDKKVLTSQFNEAGYQIARLNVLWTTCNTLSRSGRLTQWKWLLDTIWRELSPDAKQKDKDKYFKEVEELNTKIAKLQNTGDLYKSLQEKEIFLRCLQDAVGKGSKRKDFDEDDIED